MRILNIVLCVLIFILAACSAVASYLLFEKRVQMVNGWNKMAAAIQQTAAKMDDSSGTRIAADFSGDALNHRKVAELDAKLEKLRSQAENLIRQRNALADSLRKAGLSADVANLPPVSSFQALGTYAAGSRSVIAGVDQLRARRDELIELMNRSARKVGVSLSTADLKKGDARSAFQKFDSRVSGIQGQFAAYRNTLSAINARVGGEGLDFSDRNLSRALSQVTMSVQKLRDNYDVALNNISAEQRKNKQLQNEIKKGELRVRQVQERAHSKDAEIVQYRRALGMDTSGFHPWKAGSVECRRAVRGKVVAVNEKFGYIGIDLGTDSLVRQPLGGKSVEVNPQIKPGMLMYVARNPEDFNKIVYVGKVRLTAVDTDTSIAEGVELAPELKIQVGDTVFMQDGFEKIAPAAVKPAAKPAATAKPAAKK